MRRGIG
jgi:hypothetical protein